MGSSHFIIIFIVIIKNGQQCKAKRERFTPYLSKDPSHTLSPYRKKKEKQKTVKEKKGPAASADKKALTLLLRPASHTPSITGSARSFQRDTEK